MVNRSVVPRPADSGNDVNAAASDGLPKRFGKYTLLRKLATGGMAELFLALQKSVAGFEKLLVIKRILPAMNQERAFIDMLEGKNIQAVPARPAEPRRLLETEKHRSARPS